MSSPNSNGGMSGTCSLTDRLCLSNQTINTDVPFSVWFSRSQMPAETSLRSLTLSLYRGDLQANPVANPCSIASQPIYNWSMSSLNISPDPSFPERTYLINNVILSNTVANQLSNATSRNNSSGSSNTSNPLSDIPFFFRINDPESRFCLVGPFTPGQSMTHVKILASLASSQEETPSTSSRSNPSLSSPVSIVPSNVGSAPNTGADNRIPAPSPAAAAPNAGSTSSSSSSSLQLPLGGLIGIVVGAVVIVAAIGIFLHQRSQSRRRNEKASATNQDNRMGDLESAKTHATSNTRPRPMSQVLSPAAWFGVGTMHSSSNPGTPQSNAAVRGGDSQPSLLSPLQAKTSIVSTPRSGTGLVHSQVDALNKSSEHLLSPDADARYGTLSSAGSTLPRSTARSSSDANRETRAIPIAISHDSHPVVVTDGLLSTSLARSFKSNKSQPTSGRKSSDSALRAISSEEARLVADTFRRVLSSDSESKRKSMHPVDGAIIQEEEFLDNVEEAEVMVDTPSGSNHA